MSLGQPKILIFTVSSWNSKVGANTWATLVEQYDSENVANISIRDEIPDSQICSRYFAISENKVLKSIVNRKIKTGNELTFNAENDFAKEDLEEHNQRYEKYRKKRPHCLLLAREVIWKLGKWKTKELDDFLDTFKPDIILHSMEGYIHLNRIIEYAIKRTGAKAVGYVWDDNFTYKQSSSMGYKLYRYFQRQSLKRLAKKTQRFFAITPKTKREADAFFGIDSIVLTKPLNAIPQAIEHNALHYPIKLLYTGNLLIGRDRTLAALLDELKKIENIEQKVEMDIYTQTQLGADELVVFNCAFCKVHSAISQQEVLCKQKEADVLLFLEDIDGKNAKTARLSFSTKITDYLSSGKCIFAIGNADLAPIEYFQENRAALVACNKVEIGENVKLLLQDKEILQEYAKNAMECGIKNHSPELIKQKFENVIMEVYRNDL